MTVSTEKKLDEIMSLVFDAERLLKNPTMGGTQYSAAAGKLRSARIKYLVYRSSVRKDEAARSESGVENTTPVVSTDPSNGLAENIRQNMKHIRRMLDTTSTREVQILDIANHVDTLAQQIENGC